MKKAYLPLLCAMLLIVGMVGAADIFQNNEIIFPEIAAIAAGALLTPQHRRLRDLQAAVF